MTVKELIENLQGAPQDAEIRIGFGQYAARSIVLTDATPRNIIISNLQPAPDLAVLYDETQA